jgi:hypothetical protein
MIRSDEEYIYIPLHRKPYGIIREDGCQLDAFEYHNGVLCISHLLYNVRFQVDPCKIEGTYTWIRVEPREDNLKAEEILNKIRKANIVEEDEESEDDDWFDTNSLVAQLKRNTSNTSRQTQFDALRNKLKNG